MGGCRGKSRRADPGGKKKKSKYFKTHYVSAERQREIWPSSLDIAKGPCWGWNKWQGRRKRWCPLFVSTMIRLAQLHVGVMIAEGEETDRQKEIKEMPSWAPPSCVAGCSSQNTVREPASRGPFFFWLYKESGGREKSSVFTGRVTTPTGRGGYCHDDDHQPFSFPSSGINYGNINNPKRKRRTHTCACSSSGHDVGIISFVWFPTRKNYDPFSRRLVVCVWWQQLGS